MRLVGYLILSSFCCGVVISQRFPNTSPQINHRINNARFRTRTIAATPPRIVSVTNSRSNGPTSQRSRTTSIRDFKPFRLHENIKTIENNNYPWFSNGSSKSGNLIQSTRQSATLAAPTKNWSQRVDQQTTTPRRIRLNPNLNRNNVPTGIDNRNSSAYTRSRSNTSRNRVNGEARRLIDRNTNKNQTTTLRRIRLNPNQNRNNVQTGIVNRNSGANIRSRANTRGNRVISNRRINGEARRLIEGNTNKNGSNPRRQIASRTKNTSRKPITPRKPHLPRKPATPRKVINPRKPITPRKSTTPRKVITPRKSIIPRKLTTPRKVTNPRKSITPRKLTTPRKVTNPRKSITVRKQTTPRNVITPRKPIARRKSTTPRKVITPNNPIASTKPITARKPTRPKLDFAKIPLIASFVDSFTGVKDRFSIENIGNLIKLFGPVVGIGSQQPSPFGENEDMEETFEDLSAEFSDKEWEQFELELENWGPDWIDEDVSIIETQETQEIGSGFGGRIEISELPTEDNESVHNRSPIGTKMENRGNFQISSNIGQTTNPFVIAKKPDLNEKTNSDNPTTIDNWRWPNDKSLTINEDKSNRAIDNGKTALVVTPVFKPSIINGHPLPPPLPAPREERPREMDDYNFFYFQDDGESEHQTVDGQKIIVASVVDERIVSVNDHQTTTDVYDQQHYSTTMDEREKDFYNS